MKKFIKEGDALGDAARLGYYRVFKKTQDDFLKKVDRGVEGIAKRGVGSAQLLVSQTIHERADGALGVIEYFSEEIRIFSSLLENRAKQVDELVRLENGIVERFNTAVRLCCRQGEKTKGLDLGLAGQPVVKNKKAFRDIFQEEHRSVLTVAETSKPRYYQTVERLVDNSLNSRSYSFANSLYPNSVRSKHAAVLSDFDAARTELSNAFRDYRELLEAHMGD